MSGFYSPITNNSYLPTSSVPALGAPTGYEQAPIYDANGRITGYKKIQTATAKGTESGLYNPGALLPAAVDVGSGQPVNVYQDPSKTGVSAAGSAAVQPTFNLLQTTKNPGIQTNIDAATKSEGHQSESLNQNFTTYLKAAQDAQKQQAADVSKDTTTLNELPGQLAKSLDATNAAAAEKLDSANQNYQNLNTANAKTVAGDISNLDQLNAARAGATQDAVNLGVSQAQGQINQRSINPAGSTGDSSEYNQAVRGLSSDAQIALQNQLSGERIAQLTNYVTPLQQSLYSGNVAQNQFAAQVASQIAGMQTGSAEQVAALTQAVAGRPAVEAQALLSSLSLPLAVQQQVMTTIGASAGATVGADQANNFYGLSTEYNGTPITLPSYQQPNVPASGGYYSNPNGRLPTAPNVTSAPQSMGAYSSPGMNTASAAQPSGYQFGTPEYFAAVKALQTQYPGQNPGYTYDPNTGRTILTSPGAYTPAGGAAAVTNVGDYLAGAGIA